MDHNESRSHSISSGVSHSCTFAGDPEALGCSGSCCRRRVQEVVPKDLVYRLLDSYDRITILESWLRAREREIAALKTRLKK